MSIISISIILFSVLVVIFITYSNNHNECETKTESTIGVNGETIITEIHVCKERYNI
ncbi:hypothetical protein [Pontimicrobium sp. IMCC45349]|uniref:hypothetical protein n=1 Tax=Pontimicrobium sp. IMCC45349 TaxID=3391574 RepID=UPI0039A19DFE